MADRIDKIPECLCSNAGLPAGFSNALSFNEQVQWLLNAYNNLLAMVPDNVEFNGVKFIPQALTEKEKNIARENIGAGTSDITQQDINNTINNNTISYKLQQNLSAGQKELARKNIGAGTSNANYAVEYVNQNLTEQQKEDARRNIGAASEKLNGAVLTTPQALTENEKFTARNNIGIAYGFGDVPVLYNQIQLYPEAYKAQARNNIATCKFPHSFDYTITLSADKWTEYTDVPTYKIQPFINNPETIYDNKKLYIIKIKNSSTDGVSFDKSKISFVNTIINDINTIAIAVNSTDVPTTALNLIANVTIFETNVIDDEWKNNQPGTISEKNIIILGVN